MMVGFGEILGALIDASIFGTILALMSAGLSLTYSVSRIANFAHGDYAVAGMIGYILTTMLLYGKLTPEALRPEPGGITTYLRLGSAFLLAGIVALITFLLVYRPLRLRGAKPLQLMVASIGVELILRYSFHIWYLFTVGSIQISAGVYGPIAAIDGILLNFNDILPWIVGVVVVVLLALFFTRTMIGVSLRAIADNRELAEASGINTHLLEMLAWFIGGGLAGLGGVLWFLWTTPAIPLVESGWLLLAFVFAAVTLGGLGSVFSSMVAAFVIAFAYYPVSEIVIPMLQSMGLPVDVGLGYMMPLIVVIVSLLVMPEGLAPYLNKLWLLLEEKWKRIRYEHAGI